MKRLFYRSLVRVEKIEEILCLVEETERIETHELIINSLDHVVLETILHHLEESWHHEFLGKLHDDFADEAVLLWLEGKAKSGWQEAVVNAIRETKEKIKSLLVD